MNFRVELRAEFFATTCGLAAAAPKSAPGRIRGAHRMDRTKARLDRPHESYSRTSGFVEVSWPRASRCRASQHDSHSLECPIARRPFDWLRNEPAPQGDRSRPGSHRAIAS